MARPLLAQWFARAPGARVLITRLLRLALQLGLFPLLAKLFRVKQVDQKSHGKTEKEVLEMVKRTTPKGDPHAVLDAIDKFIRTEQVMLMNIGDAKGKIVQDIIAQRKPQVALELGTYIGYSAITTSCNLPDGGKLYGIDPDPTHVRIARDMIEHAGLTQKAEIIEGVLETSIPELRKRGVTTVDFVLIDHESRFYVKDLLILQQNGLLKRGSIVAADNILIPGAPEFRQYLMNSADFTTTEHVTDVQFSNYFCDIFSVSEYQGGPL